MVDEQGRDLFLSSLLRSCWLWGQSISLFSGYRRFFIPGMGKTAGPWNWPPTTIVTRG